MPDIHRRRRVRLSRRLLFLVAILVGLVVVTGAVTIGIALASRRAIATVLDRGDGLADDVREHIFEPFFTTRRDGTGLGLAVCHGLVAAHGGTIRAEPREGGGTRFVVNLPQVLVEETITEKRG